jgi:hypothetical protein
MLRILVDLFCWSSGDVPVLEYPDLKLWPAAGRDILIVPDCIFALLKFRRCSDI